MHRCQRTNVVKQLVLAQCLLIVPSSQSSDDQSVSDLRSHERERHHAVSPLESQSSTAGVHQDLPRRLVNTIPTNGKDFPVLPQKSPPVASTSEPPESARPSLPAAKLRSSNSREVKVPASADSKPTTREAAPIVASSTRTTTKGMLFDLSKVLKEPVTTTILPQSIVLMSVAMCDTLVCPAGFEHRQPAYKLGCVSEACSLNTDGQRCCVRRVQWWMYMLVFFAVFCCLSLLCGALGGYSQSYFDKLRLKQTRTNKRLVRNRSDESEDHSSQDGLLQDQYSQEAAPAATLNSGFPVSSAVHARAIIPGV